MNLRLADGQSLAQLVEALQQVGGAFAEWRQQQRDGQQSHCHPADAGQQHGRLVAQGGPGLSPVSGRGELSSELKTSSISVDAR